MLEKLKEVLLVGRGAREKSLVGGGGTIVIFLLHFSLEASPVPR